MGSPATAGSCFACAGACGAAPGAGGCACAISSSGLRISAFSTSQKLPGVAAGGVACKKQFKAGLALAQAGGEAV